MGQIISPSVDRREMLQRRLSLGVKAGGDNAPASIALGQFQRHVSERIQILLVGGGDGRASVTSALAAIPHECAHVCSGEEVFFLFATHRFDLMILDIDLPGRSGLEVLSALRRMGNHLPVLILSESAAVEERAAGLKLGADDFLIKPFAPIELVVRLQALIRVGKLGEPALRLQVHDLIMDVTSREVSRAACSVELTLLEFDVLKLLMRCVGHVVSREMLVREVWKDVKRATPMDNLIDVHIGRLRKKIDKPGTRPLIHTVRGVGFTLSEKALD